MVDGASSPGMAAGRIFKFGPAAAGALQSGRPSYQLFGPKRWVASNNRDPGPALLGRRRGVVAAIAAALGLLVSSCAADCIPRQPLEQMARRSLELPVRWPMAVPDRSWSSTPTGVGVPTRMATGRWKANRNRASRRRRRLVLLNVDQPRWRPEIDARTASIGNPPAEFFRQRQARCRPLSPAASHLNSETIATALIDGHPPAGSGGNRHGQQLEETIFPLAGRAATVKRPLEPP